MIVPTLASPPQLTAPAPAAALEERLGSADPVIRRAAIEQVLARPEAVNPYSYALLCRALWTDGRRLQAAFWFYVFQARTRAWSDLDTRGDGAGALRAALNAELGPVVNGWLGSDVAAWREVARRAIGYEARLPLGTDRPNGVGAPQYEAAVLDARRRYREGFEQTLGRATAESIAAPRREAGLRVGPLEEPGPALPDGWR